MKCISSSQTFISLKDQLEISKSEVLHYQALYEKLQVVKFLLHCVLFLCKDLSAVLMYLSFRKLQMERGALFWRELELGVKTDIIDAYKRCSAVADSRMIELETEVKKQMEDRNIVETKLKEAPKEAGC